MLFRIFKVHQISSHILNHFNIANKSLATPSRYEKPRFKSFEFTIKREREKWMSPITNLTTDEPCSASFIGHKITFQCSPTTQTLTNNNSNISHFVCGLFTFINPQRKPIRGDFSAIAEGLSVHATILMVAITIDTQRLWSCRKYPRVDAFAQHRMLRSTNADQ